MTTKPRTMCIIAASPNAVTSEATAQRRSMGERLAQANGCTQIVWAYVVPAETPEGRTIVDIDSPSLLFPAEGDAAKVYMDMVSAIDQADVVVGAWGSEIGQIESTLTLDPAAVCAEQLVTPLCISTTWCGEPAPLEDIGESQADDQLTPWVSPWPGDHDLVLEDRTANLASH